ncbi:MAG: capsular biosynthesis protein [Rhodobacteraceae bacterium]|nr:capsular biosynthesis protein [Paracoccaceae bacterium]
MIVYPAEFNAGKQAVFDALARADGGGLRLWVVPLSFRDWPETDLQVDRALSRAKRLPKSRWGLWLKRQLLRGQYNWARAHFTRHPDRVAVAWNGIAGGRMAYLAGARDAGAATLHAELAPFPGRITLDPRGVNAEGSVPQDPAVFAALSGQGSGWRAMGAQMVARPSRRADVGQDQLTPLPQTPFLFVPLQVPDDTQLRLFAGWCQDMAGFLAALTAACAHLPKGWHLRIKEHPSAKTSLAPALAPLLATGRAVLDNDSDSFAQLAASRGVVTLNSSMGLQSFFFDKPVVVLGRAYYALPGLVTVAHSRWVHDMA